MPPKNLLIFLLITIPTFFSYAQVLNWTTLQPNDTILCIINADQYVWAGTQSKGLLQIEKQSGELIYQKPVDQDFQPRFISLINFNGEIWCGTDSNGLFIYSNEEWVNLREDNSPLISNKITDLEIDHNETLWLSTNKGLIHYGQEGIEYFNQDNSGLISNNINTIHWSLDSTLWIGTNEHGVSTLKHNHWDNFTFENAGLSDNHVRDIAEANDGKILIATYETVAEYNDGDWFIFSEATAGISSNYVNGISRSPGGQIWFATHHGLTVQSGTNFDLFFETNSSLKNNIVECVSFDEAGNAWVGSFSGVNIVGEEKLFQPVGNALDISFYPNPFSTNLHWEAQLSSGQKNQVNVYNLLGEKISRLDLYEDFDGLVTGNIKTEHWQSGIYFIQINGQSAYSKSLILKY